MNLKELKAIVAERQVVVEETIGKTVAEVVLSFDRVNVRYTDGTFSAVSIEGGGDWQGDLEDTEFDFFLNDDILTLCEFGVITRAEGDSVVEAGDNDRVHDREATKAKKDRAEYERLKLIFDLPEIGESL